MSPQNFNWWLYIELLNLKQEIDRLHSSSKTIDNTNVVGVSTHHILAYHANIPSPQNATILVRLKPSLFVVARNVV